MYHIVSSKCTGIEMRIPFFQPRGGRLPLPEALQERLESIVIKGIKLNLLFQLYSGSPNSLFNVNFLPSVYPLISRLSVVESMPDFKKSCRAEMLTWELAGWVSQVVQTVPENLERVEDPAQRKLGLEDDTAVEDYFALSLAWMRDHNHRHEFDTHGRPLEPRDYNNLLLNALLRAYRAQLLNFSQTLQNEIQALEEEYPGLSEALFFEKKYLFGGSAEKISPELTQRIFRTLLLELREISASIEKRFRDFETVMQECPKSPREKDELVKKARELHNVADYFSGNTQKLKEYFQMMGEKYLAEECDRIFAHLSAMSLNAFFVSRCLPHETSREYVQELLIIYDKDASDWAAVSEERLKNLSDAELEKLILAFYDITQELEFAKQLLQKNAEGHEEQERIQVLIAKFTLMLNLIKWYSEEFKPWSSFYMSWKGSENAKSLKEECEAFLRLENNLESLLDQAHLQEPYGQFCANFFKVFYSYLNDFRARVIDYQKRLKSLDRAIKKAFSEFHSAKNGNQISLQEARNCVLSLQSIYAQVERAMTVYSDSENLKERFSKVKDELQDAGECLIAAEDRMAVSNPGFFAEQFAAELNHLVPLQTLVANFLSAKAFQKISRRQAKELAKRIEHVNYIISLSKEPQVFENLMPQLMDLNQQYLRLGHLQPLRKEGVAPELLRFIEQRATVWREANAAYYELIGKELDEERVIETLSIVNGILEKLQKHFPKNAPSFPENFNEQHRSFFAEFYFPLQEALFKELLNDISDYRENLKALLDSDENVCLADKENSTQLNFC